MSPWSKEWFPVWWLLESFIIEFYDAGAADFRYAVGPLRENRPGQVIL
jgi:hypothetical protein